jgi:hypothetical protein
MNNAREVALQYQKKYGLEDCDDAGHEVCRIKELVIDHTAIILGKNKFTGEKAVAHSHPETNISFAWPEEYARGRTVYYTDRAPDDRYKCLVRAFALLEAESVYNVLDNCQHFSTYCLTGEARSSAVDKTTDVLLWGGLLAALVGAATKSKGLMTAGLVSAATGSLGKFAEYQKQQGKTLEREVILTLAINSMEKKIASPKFNFTRMLKS